MKFYERTDDGLLVVIEGIDGSGKSTLVKNLFQHLSYLSYGIRQTREPTREPPCLGVDFEKNQLQWFLDDRAKHQAEVVLPVLERGLTVLQDRSWHSTLAYQGEHFSQEEIISEMNKRPPLLPDVFILLDIPPERAHYRVHSRRRHVSEDPMIPVEIPPRADPLELERMSRIRDRYRAMIDQPMDIAKYVIARIDAEQPPRTLTLDVFGWIRIALDRKDRLGGELDAPQVLLLDPERG